MQTSPLTNNRHNLSPKVTLWIVISLVFPTMLMPFIIGLSNVALPVIRDYFGIKPDMVAWVATAFTLPYTIMTPVYGRLSDGLGKRNLILFGSLLFVLGTTITVFASGLAWLMVGRAIQGLGTGGLMSMAMALISEIVDPAKRGKVLGAWSITGPATATIAPLVAGLMIENWGWRASMAPPLLLGFLAIIIIYRVIPSGLSAAQPGFLHTFDWPGVGLLAVLTTSFLFFLSSRPITGVAPLHDWRLLGVVLLLAALFVWWESHRASVSGDSVLPDARPSQTTARGEPLINARLFRIRIFNLATLCAALRLFVLNGLGFLVPLYLTDVRDLSPALIGLFAMIAPGAMIIMVFLGGHLSDRWGSRLPAIVGLGTQGLTALVFCLLPETAPLWTIAVIQGLYGMGLGLALAALHRAAMSRVPEGQMGTAAGLYSMFRFLGSAVGTALGGVFLTYFFERGLTTLGGYQSAFLCFAGPAFLGALVGSFLRESDTLNLYINKRSLENVG